MLCIHAKLLQSCLTQNPWAVAHQTPLSMGFSKQNTRMVAMPCSRGSSRHRDRTHVSCDSCTAGRFFTAEPLGKPMCRILVELKIMNWIALETIRKYFLIVFFPNIFADPNSKAFYLISTDSNHVCVRNDLLKRLRGPMLLTCSWGNTWSLMHLQIMSSLWKGKGK